MSAEKTWRTCENGHRFHKSRDCPVCPDCETSKKPKEGFLSLLSAPARRALENNAIQTIEQLSDYSEKEIMKLHGLGKSSIPILRAALTAKGLAF
ncbi:MAG: RNA polymerase alpha subunit C-terminal domain-containing protein [Taibaiella sp.]|nr:RNA polymerase alpha subunit C-terminal domain-containing protein [Taibaiella sp.]